MEQINTTPIWSILCQESSIDANTNNISLFKVLEEVKFEIKREALDKLKDNPKFNPTEPIFLPFTSELVILWKNPNKESDFEFPIKILLKDPDKKNIQEILNTIKFQKGKERLRSIIAINGIPLTKSGEYTYSIMVKQSENNDFEEVASVPLKITIDLKSGK